MNPHEGHGSRGRWGLVVGALVVLLPALLATGCKIGPNFHAPAIATPEKWRATEQARFVGEPLDRVEWWKGFNDPQLDWLVQQAFRQNLTLQAAGLRVVQARIGKVVAAEFLFPIVTAQGSAVRTKFSQTVTPDVNVSLPEVTVNIPPRIGELLSRLVHVSGKPSVSLVPYLDIYTAGFDALWELDIWGKNRRRLESAGASVDAAYASYDDVMVSLAGEVAGTYIQIRALQQRLAVSRRIVAEMKDFQKICEERYQNKQTPETDVQLARTLVALVEPTIPSIESSLGQTENALSILLGKMPQSWQAMLGTSAPIPSVPAKLAVGVPADLLRRRPDVRMAERMAHAQCARIGMAKAGIFPSFSLLGSLGLQSSDSGRFFERESWTGAYGGAVNATGLVWYPFLVERVRVEDARFQEAMLQYKQTVLNASREVENAQTAFLKSVEEQAILRGGSQAARRATELAIGAYRQGKVIVSVPLVALTFEAGLEEQAIAADGASAMNIVAMYKALGGGWQVREGQDLVPEEIRRQMKDRSDWWSFAGKYDLRTAQTGDAKK